MGRIKSNRIVAPSVWDALLKKGYELTSAVANILINLDLEDHVFSGLFRGAQDGAFGAALSGRIIDAGSAPFDVIANPGGTLWLFVQRQVDPTSRGTARTTSEIATLVRQLRDLQLGRNISAVHLVDCSERPADPLSDFGVLGQYLEAVGAELPPDLSARIFVLDYDMDLQDMPGPKNADLWDIRSPEFEERAVRAYLAAVRALNINET